eukprot:SAG11_NODE_225_length_12064_cov_7.850815_3_plen_359_part_00
MLVGYCSGESADLFEHLSDNHVLTAAHSTLSALFGTAPERPLAFERTAWRADPLSRGAASFSALRNDEHTWGQLAMPEHGGALWFAGEHLAHRMRLQGTIRGAFEVGRKVGLGLISARDGLGHLYHHAEATSTTTAFVGLIGNDAYSALRPRYECEDDEHWADKNGHSCAWYLAMGCPGQHAAEAEDSRLYSEQVYDGDLGQLDRCPHACGRCPERKCDDFPCFNGATCYDKEGTHPISQKLRSLDVPNDYRCVCADGWTGSDCATDQNECESNPCKNGACYDSVDNGPECEFSLNVRPTNCTDHHDYRCECDSGYTGKDCEDCESIIPIVSPCSAYTIPAICAGVLSCVICAAVYKK